MENYRKQLTKQIYVQNEIDANKALAKGCFWTALVMLLVWIFYLTGLFSASSNTLTLVNFIFPILIVLLGTSIFYTQSKIVEKPSFKYFLIVQYVLAISVLNVALPKHGILMWAACILLINHYFNPKMLLFTFIFVSIAMLISLYLGMFLGEWDANLLFGADVILDNDKVKNVLIIDGNPVNIDDLTVSQRFQYLSYLYDHGENRYLKVFLYYYVPRFLTLLIISNIGFAVSKRSMRLLVLESKSATEKEKMQSELNVATSIQMSVLPKESESENVYGLMDAAKEVGGDFYDYFYIDDSHLALVVGDVAGKGIPAALYMMKTETLIKSLALSFRHNTALIMKRSNISLCSNNDANVFVTCWLGVLNLNNGELRYTNAGHNKILIIKDGEPQYLSDKPSLVLGAFSDIEYTENKITLSKNDKILLYTDGVTETHNNKNELFGEERLLQYAKNNRNHSPKAFVLGLKKEVLEFAGDVTQFDDMTMLMYKYDEEISLVESRIFNADPKELDNLFEYSSSLLRQLEFSNRDITLINTALEEIFVNVATYAYEEKGTVEITLSKTKDSVTFIFKDNGKPFNPLDRADPDINASSDEREIGGLGIYMVKKIMDSVKYEYVNGQNVLTLIKRKNK